MTTKHPTDSAAAGQGRLAEMLAARGGTAAPEAPFVIEHREAIRDMLYLASPQRISESSNLEGC
jgi:hypothetical protein